MANTTGRTDLDVELLYSGDRFPVSAGPTLQATGWRGGQWVMYSTSSTEDFVVEASDGTAAAGFLWDGSENYALSASGPNRFASPGSANNWTNIQLRSTAHANVLTLVCGGTRAFFKVYETALLSGGTRSGSITWALNESVKVSENGLLCNDSSAELAVVGITSPLVVGIVSAVPSARNGWRLGVDIKF